MHDTSTNGLKAWAKQYQESPFFFEETSEFGSRLAAWTEDAGQVKRTFYAVLDEFPQIVDILLKICTNRSPDGETEWSRFHGVVDRKLLTGTVRENEVYVFTDGMHQLCIKDPESERYLAFDDHSIFFFYEYTAADVEIFRSHGFEHRTAKLLYSTPHYQITPPNSEKLERKFVTELGLEKVSQD
jgi:hypothetical protein